MSIICLVGRYTDEGGCTMSRTASNRAVVLPEHFLCPPFASIAYSTPRCSKPMRYAAYETWRRGSCRPSKSRLVSISRRLDHREALSAIRPRAKAHDKRGQRRHCFSRTRNLVRNGMHIGFPARSALGVCTRDGMRVQQKCRQLRNPAAIHQKAVMCAKLARRRSCSQSSLGEDEWLHYESGAGGSSRTQPKQQSLVRLSPQLQPLLNDPTDSFAHGYAET